MPKLLIKTKKKTGKIIEVTPKSAKWKYVGHDVWKLAPGKTAKGNDDKRETCIVFISGKGRVTIDGKDYGVLGERNSVFEGKPWAVYIPPKAKWSVKAENDLVINVCTAPAKGGMPIKVIDPCNAVDRNARQGFQHPLCLQYHAGMGSVG